MAASLRTRLLLSYGLLIAVLMSLFSAGSLVSLLRNPLIYESSAQRLRNAQRVATTHADRLAAISSDVGAAQMEQFANQLNTRLALVRADGTVFADSESGSAPSLRIPPVRLKLMAQRNEIAFLRDDSNRLWLALVQAIDAQSFLVLAVNRPRLAIVELFNNEFLRPALLTSLIGLGLAILIALAMAQWISAPLKRIGQAAEAVAAGHYELIPLEGPAEVRRLADSFNRMAQRVQDALQSQRELVANISHELKTPLTSIQGFTQAILDGIAQTPQEIHQAAEVIFNEANRMSRLVQDLVTLARLEAKTGDLQRASIDIAALARGVVEKFLPRAAQANVQLALDTPDLPWLVGDEDRLVQVLSNLVDNAIKYTPAGGVVRINIRPRNGRGVEIRVADTGVGIPPADRERIFQRFYRADLSQPGMGLGLAITRQIVLAHGGNIRVEENLPHGSVFVVDLPAAAG